MKILLIEDEQYKKKDITQYLRQSWSKTQIKCVGSIMSGIIELSNNVYDLVILDMSLPLYELGINDENNEFVPFGGLDILDEIDRLQLSCKVFVFTAYDVIEDNLTRLTLSELDKEMNNEYPNNYVGCIHYDQSSLEWKTEIDYWIGEII